MQIGRSDTREARPPCTSQMKFNYPSRGARFFSALDRILKAVVRLFRR
ncbi:hypothetical protein ABID77_004124 [Variovorax sp. PvP013]